MRNSLIRPERGFSIGQIRKEMNGAWQLAAATASDSESDPSLDSYLGVRNDRNLDLLRADKPSS